jgi:undecaprenyl-diphosphatase
MHLVEVILLGIIQGLTEFLPISSSGHLILARWLFNWHLSEDAALRFDVALHMGTLLALLIYFWRDWLRLAGAMLVGFAMRLRRSSRVRSADACRDERLAWLLAAATVPAAIVGVVGEHYIEQTLRRPMLVAILLIAVGVLLLVADRAGRGHRRLECVGWKDALLIGMSQALALAPGVSRSGITITAGLLRGFDREAAARFSFLLSMPITAGAGLLELRRLLHAGLAPAEALSFAVGAVAAAISGLLAISFLLRFVRRYSLAAFAYYRFLLGGAVLALVLLGAR